jgi:protein-tyrosine phosphatase
MSQPLAPIQSVLFVCTGNIFRSLAAEHAFKSKLEDKSACIVGSAGIDAKPQAVHEWALARLEMRGADASTHVPRRLTRKLVEEADLVVAMGRNHQTFIRERFGRHVPLFNQVCFGRDEPIQDVHEAMPAWEDEPERARAYIWEVIDRIWEATPVLISRMHLFR